MDENDQMWHGRLLKCFAAAHAWELRITSPDDVEVGSSLASDDKRLVTAPVRGAAWAGLVSAVDHLALMADLARDEVNMRPTSLFTPTRAALLGASQAVWVLTGGRPTRRARALAIAVDERSQHRKFLRDYTADDYAKANFNHEFMGEMGDLVNRLTAEIARLRELQKVHPKNDSDATTMMREAAEHLTNASTPGDEWTRFALAYEWRVASAATHGRTWPAFVRQTEKFKTEDGEIRRLPTTAKELGMAVGAATLMTSEAWRLWDLRRAKQH